jgi:KDO2-lipid IV(A) lauroyltransferase
MSFVKNQKVKIIRRETLLLLAYPFLRLVILFVRFYPKSHRAALGTFLGKQAYKFNKTSRKRTLNSLTIAYGDMLTPEKIEEMAKEVFVNTAKTVVDFYATVHITDKKRFFEMVEVEGEEHLKTAYEQKKGVICLVPHLSSWELSAVTPPMLGYSTSAASKAIKGFLIQRMMVRFRSRRGMKNISRENSYKKLVKALEAGDCLIVMIDQDTKVKGVFVDFYGKKAYTPMGVSRLALETGAIVVPMAMVRKEDSKYKFIIRPPLETINTGNLEKDLYDNTQQQTLVLEKIIRQYPTQWVWMHRRWKTTPESLAAYLEQRAAEKAKRNKKQNA